MNRRQPQTGGSVFQIIVILLLLIIVLLIGLPVIGAIFGSLFLL